MRDYMKSLSITSARALINLTESLAVPFLGDPPTNANGAKMDPQLHAHALAGQWFPLRRFLEQGPTYARRVSRVGMRILDVDTIELPRVEDRSIQGSAGNLRIRCYSPNTSATLPGCVFYHGGGFVLGDLDTHDGFCRMLANHGNCHVVSVDYRLAPEHPFPAAVEDAVSAYRWTLEHSGELNIDPDRLAVAGDSVGGTLATVVCQRQIAEQENSPDLQLLIYPKTDHAGTYPSRHQTEENRLLTWDAVRWFADQYLSGVDVDPETDHRISPLQFDHLEAMPPTLFATAGFDPLRDEGEAYATALEENGVALRHHQYEHLVHGFISLGGILNRAREAMYELCYEFREKMR